jgi:ketosteroid isomerase-like protein
VPNRRERITRPDYYGNPAGLTGDADAVRAIYAAFARRDPEAALPLIDEACELHLRGTADATGRPDPYVGHAGVRQYFADVAAVWDELVLHADDFRVMPGIVIVLGHVVLRRGELSTRRAVIWTWRLRDGKAISVKVADAGAFRDPADAQ